MFNKNALSLVWLDSLPGGRASFALPRAILRVEAEKAGAGMCRLGFFGQDAFTGMGFPRRLDQKSPLSIDSELSPFS